MVEVTINGETMDIAQTSPLAISKSIDDARSLEYRRGDFVEKIVLPATAKNNLVLTRFSLPTNNNIPTKQDITIKDGGYVIFKGEAYPTGGKFKLFPQTTQIEAIGGNSLWADLLKKPLNQIAVVENIDYTWAAVQTVNGLFPSGGTQSHCFPLVHYGAFGSPEVELRDLRPAVSALWLLRTIFAEAGYSIGGQFINSAFFSKLIIPFGVGEWNDQSQEFVNYVLAETNGTQIINTPLALPNLYDAVVDFQNEIQDPDSVFLTNTFTCTVAGVYDVQVRVILQADLFFSYQAELELYKNGLSYTSDPHPVQPDQILTMQVAVPITMAVGDTLFAKIINLGTDGNGITHNNYFTILDTSFFEIKRRVLVLPNDTGIPIQSILWGDKTQLDFVKGLINLFNFQAATDDINKIVVFEPSFDNSIAAQNNTGFYRPPQLASDDYTDRVDLSIDADLSVNRPQQQFISLCYNSDGNDAEVSDAEKKVQEKANIAASNTTKYIKPQLAQAYFDTGNNSEATETNIKELRNPFFAATMHINTKEIGVSGGSIYMPMIWNSTGSIAFQPPAEYKSEPRLLYWDTAQPQAPKLEAVAPAMFFPKVYAVDYAPQSGINPLDCPNLYFSDEVTGAVLNKGLLSKFWLPSIVQINNGLFLKANLKLSRAQVNNYLIWRNTKRILNESYILKVIDGYKAGQDESTACELLKYKLPTIQDNDNTHPFYIGTATTEFVVNGLKK